MKLFLPGMFVLLMPLLGGCMRSSSASQPYVTTARLDRGFVIVLTGIEGRSRLNEEIVAGLNRGGVKYAIEIHDWTGSWFWLANQESETRNRSRAAELADKITRYKWAYPDRPVILVGQSGGAAIAAWSAEAMKREKVDGIIMLAASLSSTYRLDNALTNSRRGIVNFYSGRDLVMLGLGTKIFRTMDGEFASSAGMEGFALPKTEPDIYEKLFQIAWNKRMADSGNSGLHITSGAETFVAQYVVPFVLSYQWDEDLVKKVSSGEYSVINRKNDSTKDTGN